MSHDQEKYVKARQDAKFYYQGKVQLGKTNITRDIAVQLYFYFAFLTQALNCLRRKYLTQMHGRRLL